MRDGVETRYLYALRPKGMAGPVKFGCSIEPEERLLAYARWSPFQLELAFRIPGNMSLERKVHRYCAASHSHNEWFAASERVEEIIAIVSAGADLLGFLNAQELPDHPDTEARKVAAMAPEVRAARSRKMKRYWSIYKAKHAAA